MYVLSCFWRDHLLTGKLAAVLWFLFMQPFLGRFSDSRTLRYFEALRWRKYWYVEYINHKYPAGLTKPISQSPFPGESLTLPIATECFVGKRRGKYTLLVTHYNNWSLIKYDIFIVLDKRIIKISYLLTGSRV